MNVGVDVAAGVTTLGRIKARVQAACSEPVTKFVVVGGHGKNHAHAKTLALVTVLFDDRFQGSGIDGMSGVAVAAIVDVWAHLLPDVVGYGDTVTVQVHAEGSDDVRLGAVADSGPQWLARQHVGAIQGAGHDAVQQDFPVGLGFQFHKQALIQEKTLFPGNGQWRHIGQFDEAEFQVWLFGRADVGVCRACRRQDQECRCQCSQMHGALPEYYSDKKKPAPRFRGAGLNA